MALQKVLYISGKTVIAADNLNDIQDAIIALEGKAIPENTSDLTNDSGFITNAVNDLANYFLKSETYSRDEINQKISAIPKFSIQVVSSLPTSGISATTVYLLKTGDESNNLYTEYIYVNGAWEYLGKQTVDLSGYAKKATTLAGYGITDGALKSEIPTKTSQLTNDSKFLTAVPSEYVTETELNNKGYATTTHLNQLSEEIGNLKYADITFDKFPTIEEINALPNWSYFGTKGFHAKNDGLAAIYQVKNSPGVFYVPYGDMYVRPIMTDYDNRDIYVDLYGVRRGGADYAVQNSEIMDALISTLPNGYTFHFASGHYYFENPIVVNKYTVFKGASSDACVYGNPNVNNDANHGSYLHFPNLANGEAAISISSGVIEDLEITGNPSICDVSLNRDNTLIAPNSIVSLVDTGTTYGIKVQANHTIQNVKVRNCTYGIYAESTNALISNIDILKCKVGISVGNDIKINNVQVWNVMVGLELRGQLASATNIRGDSIGKHLIECKKGKCLLTNIDGDYCVGSLIHYGGSATYIHLGQATACMGRVATKHAYSRITGFDLRNVPDADYEYCSYISIAPNTQVFGGHIDVVNVSSNPHDASSSYLHPRAAISIGTGSTVKGLTIRCDIPSDADVEYLNKNIIKNLSTYAEGGNDTIVYLTDFDGVTIEDICFITAGGFIRTRRITAIPERKIVTEDENLQELSKMVETVGVSIPSINLCDGVYEYGRFAAAGTEYTDTKAFRTKNYLPVEGGRTIAFWFDYADWNKNNKGAAVQVVQYDSSKDILVSRVDVNAYVANESSLTLDANTAYVRFDLYPNEAFSTPLTNIEIGMYYIEDVVLGFVSPEPTIVGDKKVLNLQNAVIYSSTAGSTKKFCLMVNDDGVLKTVEAT